MLIFCAQRSGALKVQRARTCMHGCIIVVTSAQQVCIIIWIDLWTYFDFDSDGYITGPTDDEDNQVYRPSRNDALSTLEYLRNGSVHVA